MNESHATSWQLLLLTCLHAAGESGESIPKLRKCLEKWISKPGASEQEGLLLTDLKALTREGYCIAEKSGRTLRWRITPPGRKVVADALGLPEPDKRYTWKDVSTIYFPGMILDCIPKTKEQARKLNSISGLRAAVLKKTYALQAPEFPTYKQAADAFLWRQLGMESNAPFSLEAVKCCLLTKALGVSGSTLKSTQLQSTLASCAVGASRNDLAALRDAIVGSWLHHDTDAVALVESEAANSVVISEFAEEVRHIARACKEGRFGDTLVFINHAYHRYQEYKQAEMNLERFKHLLVEAQDAGLLVLVRADLVAAMKSHDVEDSEVRHLNTTFHFIRSQ